MTAELRSLPAVGVMTEAFVSAAELMGRVLGAEGYPFVTIPHPLSSAGREALNDAARIAADDAAGLLTGSAPASP